jgi:hypothetical protein
MLDNRVLRAQFGPRGQRERESERKEVREGVETYLMRIFTKYC